MKKLSVTFILSLLALVSCGGATPHKILSPTGAPAAAFYSFSTDERFETNSNANNIQGMMSRSNEYAVIILDTVSGISAIKNGAKFKIASTITFGNLYIGATNDTHKTMSKGDSMVLFGNKAQVPYALYNYLYKDIGLEVTFVNAAADAMKALKTGLVDGNKVDFVLVAEPTITANNLNDKIILNIRDEYKKKSGFDVMQASIFVSDYADKNEVNNILNKVESSINAALLDPSLIKTGIEAGGDIDAQKLKYGVAGSMFSKVTANGNKLGLGYKKAIENIDAINTYISAFGMEKTDEKIYYK